MSTMAGTQQSDIIRRNLLSLKKKAYEIKFDLEASNYVAIENIGSGAYGVVCSALHKKTKEKVAIKKTPDIFQHSELAKRTYREIKILLHFNHDNIISIREILSPGAGKDLKDVYIVLDLMESDLHQIIHTNQPLTNEHACYFLYQILRGMKYIHSANVIHRDLKPSNLLVNENCDLKIGDFGMARGFLSHQSEVPDHVMTQYVATRWYRAPEIILSMAGYTAAVDVWSVGCIFAEMLGRHQLFPGSNTVNQLKLIRNLLGPPPKKFLQKCRTSCLYNGIMNSDVLREPMALTTLYPKASNKAKHLLGCMLTFDPDERLTVEAALKHPYLSKYHNPADEPRCIPAFDFSFENKVMTTESIKQNILKEIANRQKETTSDIVYNFKIFPKEEQCKTSLPMTSLNKSEESLVCTTPPAAAAAKHSEEICQPESDESGQRLEDKNVARSSEMVIGNTAIMHLKVDPGKMAADVEMLSAKSKELRIGSPCPAELPPAESARSTPLTVTDSIKQNILKVIADRQKEVALNSVKKVPSEERCKRTLETIPPSKSTENLDCTTPRIAAAIKWIEEIARQQRDDDSGQQLEHEEATSSQMDTRSTVVAQLKVESDKIADDVEMLSAKTKELRIGSPPPSEQPPGGNLRSTPATELPDVEMPSAKPEEVMMAREEAVTKQDVVKKMLTTKALIKAAILNGKKGRSAPETEITKPRTTALQRQRQREDKRKRRQSRALEKKKKQEKDANTKLLLSSEDRNLLERWKTMQQGTLPFVHPIRSHMKDIVRLRQVEASAPSAGDQPGVETGAPLGSRVLETVACVPVTVYNGGVVGAALTAGSYPSGVLGSMNQSTTAVNVLGRTISKPILQMLASEAITTTTNTAAGNFHQTLQGGVSNQLPLTAQQPIRIAPQPAHIGGVLQQQQLMRQSLLQLDRVSGHVMSVTSQPIVVPSQPLVVPSQPIVVPSQPILMTSQPIAVTSQPIVVTSNGIGMPSEMGAISSQQNILAVAHEQKRTPSPSQPHSSQGMKLSVDAPLTQGVDTPPAEPTYVSFTSPSLFLPGGDQAPAWSSNPEPVHTERLPSYTEAQHKTFPTPLFREVTSESIPEPHPASIVANQQTAAGRPIPPPNQPIIDIQQDHATNDAVGGVMLKVTTITKLLHKAHMDDLTLATTPKGTGGGYGVGLDFDMLLAETVPMDTDQESTRSTSAPVSAGLLADWQELCGHMNQGELERELELGFPSPLSH